jgi:predicted enzyme related to lactoylglutathione lyase
MQPQPLIAVSDVQASSQWYQAVLACESGHGRRECEQILSHGNCVVLWFLIDAFDATVERVRALGAEILGESKINPSANLREI